ncbi:hypothetical protein HCA55_16345 [Listeria booriae]|uniref:Fibronectin type-III domain-containing protein n=1 Tax=Listeria booriae TaxID=1552123 RepID=A0A842B7L1_9LIST|nr:hypothetical protein [Listeria booriae]MBC1798309.1 hypothetical protein [Listeria booriae]
MKKGKVIGISLIVFMMFVPSLTVFAASKSFSFDMKHQLSIGSYKSTKTSVTGKVSMSNWGGDNYFTIHVYRKDLLSTKLMGKMTFSKSSAGSPYYSTLKGLTKGTTYRYEIWKNQNGKRIVGTGNLDY